MQRRQTPLKVYGRSPRNFPPGGRCTTGTSAAEWRRVGATRTVSARRRRTGRVEAKRRRARGLSFGKARAKLLQPRVALGSKQGAELEVCHQTEQRDLEEAQIAVRQQSEHCID